MKIFLILFSFYCINAVNAQHYAIKFAPLNLIDDVSFPTIQGGIEVPIKKNWSWYNEFGYKYRKSVDEAADTNFIDSKGFKIKSEIRKYLTLNQRANSYIAFSYLMSKDNYNNSAAFFPKDSINIIATIDNYAVKKSVNALSFMLGIQGKLIKGLGYDMYCGLGLRHRKYRTFNQVANLNIHDIEHPVDWTPSTTDRLNELCQINNFVPNITLGFRLCYFF
jgi:hypothetical protein